MTDKLGNQTKKDINARTLGRAPIIASILLESKTSSSITINATAIDEDNDKLVYKLYVGESSNKLTLANTSTEMEQGIETILSKSYLTEYTTYYYRVDVTDGINITQGNVASIKTMCSGRTLTCNSAKRCSTCSGNGTVSCNSSKNTYIYETSKFTCAGCRKEFTTNGYYKTTCSICGGGRGAYFQCNSCGVNTSKKISTGSGRHTCTSCRRFGRNKMFTWICKLTWVLFTWIHFRT